MKNTTKPNRSTLLVQHHHITRSKLLVQLRQAAREAGLEGESYRVALEKLTGKRSATVLATSEIQATTIEFRKQAQAAFAKRPECSTEALEREYGL